MNSPRPLLKPSRRRPRGMALIVVISVLTLATVLLLALLSTTQTELKATVAFADGSAARINADSAVNIVMGQIRKATEQRSDVTGREIWTSQPGMVRQYRETGVLLGGHKLYSDRTMTATTESAIAADLPAWNWDTLPDNYVDLNEPVARLDPANPAAAPRWFFPIIDPRAYSTDPQNSVEGFSYTTSTNGVAGGTSLAGVVLPSGGGASDGQRLPMPVEWLYMLKDGTLGYLSNAGKFVGAGGVKASIDNPIVSRVAFWADDESCKININTAGEGTAWDTPRLFHDRDGDWARFQPMAYEYQRYPGHPATVCMSTVLFPGKDMNVRKDVDEDAFNKIRDYKEKIYELMPKILPGGSRSGSVLVPAGRAFTPTDFAEVQNALGERLFASVDEFLLRSKTGSGGTRDEIDLATAGVWSGVSRPDLMQRLRPFLTPHSRSPETNPFGLPKISMWPEHRMNTSDYRTVFDKTIAYCSTLAGRDYFFTRQDSTSQTEITGIARNKQLFDYLMALTAQPIPGFSPSTSATFEAKYGDNRQQILVEIFDYIRSTNLYDDAIAEKSVGLTPSITGLPDNRLTAYSVAGGLKSKTFTPIRNADGNSFAGHGQVTPTVLPKGKDEVYRGMGRFLTISEVGLNFIACAQGTDIAGGASAARITPATPPAEANYTPPNWRGGDWGNYDFWYSNFPPLSATNQDPANGFYKSKYPTQHELEGKKGDEALHPGYNPLNWNWTLDKDAPLASGMKRVQATFLLEWFCPATGWTLINPDIQIEVDASSLTVGSQKMFPVNGGKTVIRPFKHMSNAWGIYQRGGTISYRAFLQERKLPAVAAGVNGNTKGSILFPDTNIPVNDTDKPPYTPGKVDYSYYSSRSDILKACNQYNLVSDFFDVPVDDPTTPATEDGKIPFSGGSVTVKIMTNTSPAKVLQTFEFDFPKADFLAPRLVTRNENTTWGKNFDGSYYVRQPVPAPYWWSYHSDGALGRDQSGRITSTAAYPRTRMGGRFRYIGNEIGSYGETPASGTYNRGNLVTWDDTFQSLVLRHGDPRLTMGQFVVPSGEFEQHRFYGDPARRMAHNIVLAHWSDGPGLDRGEDKLGGRLVRNADYFFSFVPDHPYSPGTSAGLQRYGDFDRGIANQTDGAYINKPDEGNAYGKVNTTTQEQAVPYFTDAWVMWMGGATYFSPNRQVPSPGMFGSLPTGVHASGTAPAGRKREPWRTLLFRPQTWSTALNQQAHPGAPKFIKGYGGNFNNQGFDPPDYLFMDFFWMPVVEPYAISEPGSTMGKINLNYRMAPFQHIHRSTALHGVMKSEALTAVAHADANYYLRRPRAAPTGKGETWFAKEHVENVYDIRGKQVNVGRLFWHRKVDTEATLKLFEERFRSGFAFISPAQICEMHLLPKRMDSSDVRVPEPWPDNFKDLLKVGAPNGITKFWEDHAITAENLKERPYTNMYPRLTTRSNTFQVHVRSQVVRKARSTDPETFDSTKDSVTAEYRGSVVVERYLDLNQPQLAAGSTLDYAGANPLSKPTLDSLHRFRVIAQKRFDP